MNARDMLWRGDCKPRPLAHNEVGSVRACACGKLHLTVGYLTLTFDTSGLASMYALIERALMAQSRARQLDRDNIDFLLGRFDADGNGDGSRP